MHSWDLTPKEAIALQQQLRSRVKLKPPPKTIRRVAGVDVGFEEKGRITRAAISVLSFPELSLIDVAVERQPTRFPYVPGLLSFRELPCILSAIERLSTQPDIWLCDGMGLAHPRRLGIATHLGLWLDVPTVGVAKSRLCGRHGELPADKNACTPLLDGNELVGVVLRSRAGVKPIFVSPGHRMSVIGALQLTRACITRFRLPETTRTAHKLASDLRYR